MACFHVLLYLFSLLFIRSYNPLDSPPIPGEIRFTRRTSIISTYTGETYQWMPSITSTEYIFLFLYSIKFHFCLGSRLCNWTKTGSYFRNEYSGYDSPYFICSIAPRIHFSARDVSRSRSRFAKERKKINRFYEYNWCDCFRIVNWERKKYRG